MLKCAVYIRVSTNREEQKNSLKNQQDLFVDYISKKGWSVSKFYIDVDSGTNGKRKQLQELIKDAENKRFDVILSKELSRLARNSELSHKIKRIAENNNIHIITLDGAIDTMQGNRALFGMYAWIYEQESQRMSERIKYALEARAKRGKFNGTIPPYGYFYDNGILYVKNDFTPGIVRRIFSSYINGKGFDHIARELYNEGIPTPAQVAGKPNSTDKWHGSGVRIILENQHYTGCLVQGRSATISVTTNKRRFANESDYHIVENTHEALISRDDFLLVKNLIKSRRRIRPVQNVHLFSNLLVCLDCKHGMHFKKNRRGYICGNYNKHGKKACSDHIVREDELSRFVLLNIDKLIHGIKTGIYNNDLELSIENKKNLTKKKHDESLKKLEKLKDKKSKALHLLIDDKISKDDYDAFINEIDQSSKSLISKIDECKSILNDKFSSKIINEIEYVKNTDFDLTNLNRALLNRFISYIQIDEEGKAIIHYRISHFNSII